MISIPGPFTHALRRRVHGWAYRLRQGVAFAKPQSPPTIPPDVALHLHLHPGSLRRLQALTPADQRHLLVVGLHLRDRGASSDLWIAGLLHDIGKAYDGYHARLIDRAAWVLVSRVGPIDRLVMQRTQVPVLGRGIWILAHHAELGCAMLQDLGYNERICTLVAFHDDDARARLDPELALLQVADNAPFSVPVQGRRALESSEVLRGCTG